MEDMMRAVRFRAAKRMLWSGVPVVLMIMFNVYYAGTNAPKYGMIMTGLTAACVPFLADLVQVISGVSFVQLSEKWDNLENNHRYLLAIGVVLAFIASLFVVVPIIAAFWR